VLLPAYRDAARAHGWLGLGAARMDFDELDVAEDEREVSEVPLRIAEEDAAVLAEEGEHFTARLVGKETDVAVSFYREPDTAAAFVGERRIGEVLRFTRRSGAWALLHPLELARISEDYQDYWNAVLTGEVPRRGLDAWVPIACLTPLPEGEPTDPYGEPCLQPEENSPAEVSLLTRSASNDWENGTANLVGDLLTIIVSTSPAEHHCDTKVLLRVLQSLQDNEALAPCRKLVVFDAMPSEADHRTAAEEGELVETGKRWVPQESQRLAEKYLRYQSAVEEAVRSGDPAMARAEILAMPRWGHLVGTVRHALERVTTPFVFLHQHDLLLSEDFTKLHAVGILRALAERTANYVVLNRDVNFSHRSTDYFQAAPDRVDTWRSFVRQHTLRLDDGGEGMPLTPFIGYSDQTHFARASWVRDRVLQMVGSRKCCMEFAVYEVLLLAWLRDPARRWERTYMLGGMLDGPFIYDMVKNGSCWATLDDAYSEEKVEDMVYVHPDKRVMHPKLPGHALSLYICDASFWSCLPGGDATGECQRQCRHPVAYFPDTDSERNKWSMDRFGLLEPPRPRPAVAQAR